jgi:surfeit locus 1 family protein
VCRNKIIQFKVVQQRFEVVLGLIITYLIVLTVLINLGIWQLSRATEKQIFIQQQEQQAPQILALTAKTADTPDLRYRPVRVEGLYAPEKQFLIDNQMSKGKAGYLILTPFKLKASQKWVLVNRGWLPRHPNRSILPDISLTKNTTQITGRINNFPSVGLKLEGAEIPTPDWPSVVQVVNSQVLAQKLGYDLFSFQIELNTTEPYGYHRDWMAVARMPPEKHVAYAIQWFGLAITLTFLFFWHSRKKTAR